MKAQNLALVWSVQRQVVETLRGSSQTVKGQPSFTEHVPVCGLFLGPPRYHFIWSSRLPVSQALARCHPQVKMRQLKRKEVKYLA